ncbi:MAG: putative flippase GtrA [Rickettsiales bacterium]|jgi:putative flippase GtrA
MNKLTKQSIKETLTFNNIINIYLNNEKIRFLVIGGYNTAFSYGVFCLLELLFGLKIHYLTILVVTHFISVSNSFFTLRFLVFHSKGKLLHEYLKVNLVYLGYLICNAALLFVLKDLAHVNIFLSQLICIIILTILTYFLHKNFSFKNHLS